MGEVRVSDVKTHMDRNVQMKTHHISLVLQSIHTDMAHLLLIVSIFILKECSGPVDSGTTLPVMYFHYIFLFFYVAETIDLNVLI